MVKFLAKRFLQMGFLFLIFLTILFLILSAQPGDIAQKFVGNPDIPPEAKELLRRELGLDQPVFVQYLNYIKNFFTLNLGVSFDHYPRPVSEILLQALPRTIWLFLTATILAYAVGFQTGKLAAWRRGTFLEKASMTGGVVLYTVFYPWFALLMLWFFGYQVGLFPLGKFLTPEKWIGAGYAANDVFRSMLVTAIVVSGLAFAALALSRRIAEPRTQRLVFRLSLAGLIVMTVLYWMNNPMRPFATDIAYHTILPVVTLTLVFYAGITLLTRSSMLETLREDYILTARAKGVPDRVIRDRHAARNALLPVTTSFVLAIAFVIGGGIVTESIFSWPGLGLTLLNAVTVEDVPVAMGALAFIGVLALIAHLIADILYAVLDPRIRVQA